MAGEIRHGNATLIIHSANQRARQEIRIAGYTWEDLAEQGTVTHGKECRHVGEIGSN
jgi:hypothetical protein